MPRFDRRRPFTWTGLMAIAVVVGLAALGGQAPPAGVGTFTGHADVGTVLHPGAATFDPATRTYTQSGSGGTPTARRC